jgi:hypothetical protein
MTSAKFGCIALLDALGTRTASVANAQAYLTALADIRALMTQFQSRDIPVQGAAVPGHPGGEFRIRFFGDAILITLPFGRDELNWAPIARMFSGTAAVVAAGVSRGIFFRGALAIGPYIESEDAVLGPAVLDAAHWYEMADMFGVIATPNAMFSILRIASDCDSLGSPRRGVDEALGVAYPVPLKNGKTLTTRVADWPFSATIQSSEAMANTERWFFAKLQDALISPDVESKYTHSLEFLRYCAGRVRRP